MVVGGLLPSTPIANVAVIVVASALIWLGSGWLEESAEHLSAFYGLPAVVQGSVVVAVGSSFPELASVVFAALAGVFEMGVGGIVGSAIFNILVIPALVGMTTDDIVESSRAIVYKEAQFYMIAVSALVVTLALAVIYYPVPGNGALLGTVTRPLALIPLALYGLYVFIQWQDVSDHDAGTPPSIDVMKEWGKLVAGLLIILVTVEQLVGALESLSHAFGIPTFLAGIILLASATSLPDALVSIRAGRSGKDITALGNVLGSNTFDLLVAIPLGVLIVGGTAVNFSTAVPMLGVLTLATVLLFAILRTDLSMSDAEAYTLLLAYALFVAWVLLETLGVTAVLKG